MTSPLNALRGISTMADLIGWIEDNVLDSDMALALANHLALAVDGLTQLLTKAGYPLQKFPFTYHLGPVVICDEPVNCLVLTLDWFNGERINWALELNDHEQVIRVCLFTLPPPLQPVNRTLH